MAQLDSETLKKLLREVMELQRTYSGEKRNIKNERIEQLRALIGKYYKDLQDANKTN